MTNSRAKGVRGELEWRDWRDHVAHRSRKNLAERFWGRVSQAGPGECWEWVGSRMSDGYGRIEHGSIISGTCISQLAHRVSWMIAHDRWVPDGLFVCHTCDNRPCVNPNHLFLGTPDDNMQDKKRKGRQSRLPGESNPRAVLTAVDVAHIRRLRSSGASLSDIGDKFGVSISNVSAIALRKRWGHVS